MKPRVTVVTAGHLSTCPRMLKAADALCDAGYRVRFVYARHTPWATAADEATRATRRWDAAVVDYSRATARRRQVTSGARFRAAQAVTRVIGAAHVPLPVAIRTYSRLHGELVAAIASQPADLVYGGTTGALAAVAEAAGRLRVPYALDLEDFHSGEHAAPEGAMENALAERVERHVLRGAAFLTAASPMIAEAYEQKYDVRPRPIHNTFSIRFPETGSGDDRQMLRLYWFSQTLGPGRGLEDVIEAVGRTGVDAELHLRAAAIASYLEALRRLQRSLARSLTIVHHDPAAPDDMVALAQGYDLGLACEQPNVVNSRLCLSNKIFTYLAAGVPVVLSATPAQERLARDLGHAALVYGSGDVEALAAHLRRWVADRALRRHMHEAARAAAERRWHWEHPEDRGALLAVVKSAVG